MGRILGPRGMTAKQLEQETGCKIMVRGKGSMRDKQKVKVNGSPYYNDEGQSEGKLRYLSDEVQQAEEGISFSTPTGYDTDFSSWQKITSPK